MHTRHVCVCVLTVSATSAGLLKSHKRRRGFADEPEPSGSCALERCLGGLPVYRGCLVWPCPAAGGGAEGGEGWGEGRRGWGGKRGGGGSKKQRGKSLKVSTSQCKLVMQHIHIMYKAHKVP